MKITFTGYTKSETLTNFPLLLTLSNNIAASGFDYSTFLSTNACDLRFWNSNDTRELNYEIEEWNTSGASYIWVQIPKLVDTNTHIWAKWADSSQTNREAYTTNGATWSNGYAGVWHMNENSASDDTRDSSSNNADGAANNSPTVVVGGKIAGSRQFNGSNQKFVVPGGKINLADNSFTVSCWARPAGISGSDYWGGQGTGAIRQGLHTGYRDGNTVTLAFYGDDVNSPDYNSDTGEWHYWSLTYKTAGKTQLIYRDGVEAARRTATGNYIGSGVFNHGTALTGSAHWFNGPLDEMRISDTIARSSNWIWACWLNQASNHTFNTLSAVSAGQLPSINNASGPTGITANAAWLNGTLTSTGASPTEVRLYWGPTDGGTNTAAWANTNYLGTNAAVPPVSYTTNLSLNSDTLYYYRYAAANANGTAWANSSASFVTAEITLLATDPGASEIGPDNGTFTITRPGIGTNENLTINYTIGGTASNGLDYAVIGTSLVIPEGALSSIITITPCKDRTNDVDETIVLTLAAGKYAIGTPAGDEITITNAPYAGHLYVDKNACGQNNGYTWPDAFTTMTNAAANAIDGDDFRVAQGTYNDGASITIATPNISIYGGFTNGMTSLTRRDPARHVTTLDGANARRVMSITTAATNVTLDGIRIIRGRSPYNQNGGGLLNDGAGTTLTNCVVTACSLWGNESTRRGGAICSTASMNLYGTEISSNTANFQQCGGGGGLAFQSGGTLTIVNSLFRANTTGNGTSTNPDQAQGSAIRFRTGTLIMKNTILDHNSALNGHYLYPTYRAQSCLNFSGVAANLENCTFAYNSAPEGGAICHRSGTMTATNCIFWQNTATYSNPREIYGAVKLSYGCMTGTNAAYISASATLNNVIINNPLFAGTYDFHLKSRAGRWTGAGWVTDPVTSPCIDMGDPSHDPTYEPLPNGGRVNLGAYGGTQEASKTRHVMVIYFK